MINVSLRSYSTINQYSCNLFHICLPSFTLQSSVTIRLSTLLVPCLIWPACPRPRMCIAPQLPCAHHMRDIDITIRPSYSCTPSLSVSLSTPSLVSSHTASIDTGRAARRVCHVTFQQSLGCLRPKSGLRHCATAQRPHLSAGRESPRAACYYSRPL